MLTYASARGLRNSIAHLGLLAWKCTSPEGSCAVVKQLHTHIRIDSSTVLHAMRRAGAWPRNVHLTVR